MFFSCIQGCSQILNDFYLIIINNLNNLFSHNFTIFFQIVFHNFDLTFSNNDIHLLHYLMIIAFLHTVWRCWYLSSRTSNWFTDHGIDELDWPANSPDRHATQAWAVSHNCQNENQKKKAWVISTYVWWIWNI